MIDPYLLIGSRFLRLAHQLLHPLKATHLFVNGLQDLGPLLQAEKNIFLNQREFNLPRKLFELLELFVGLI